jgi:hypothetical protein
MGVYLPGDSYSSLNSALLAKFDHGYNPQFMHTYRNWDDKHQEPVRITRDYFMQHFSFVKALVSRHYSGTSNQEKPRQAHAAKATADPKGPPAVAAVATAPTGDRWIGPRPRTPKGAKKGGDTPAKKQCHRCTDKAPHFAEDCPHAGKNKGLKCRVCERDSHDSAACWQKHPELDTGRANREKGKGKGGKTGKPGKPGKQGKGVAPAGGAPARTK